MSSLNILEALQKNQPAFKVQIALTGNRAVLCFSKQDQAQDYFASLGQNSDLDPSVDGLEVSISLQRAKRIELGKEPNRTFTITFEGSSAAEKWLEDSRLRKFLLQGKRSRDVVIAESSLGLTGRENPPQPGTRLGGANNPRRKQSVRGERSNEGRGSEQTWLPSGRARPGKQKGVDRSDSMTSKGLRGLEKLTGKGSPESNDG